jgi:adenine phosphoribosyltransferase
MDLKTFVRCVQGFPKTGIDFKDITPLLSNPHAFSHCLDGLEALARGLNFNKIGAFDARGFWFAPALADRLKVGWFPIRKVGKLPYTTISQSYGLEYGKDTVAIHIDAAQPGDRVLLVDDLLATGGTLKAGVQLVNKLGAEVVAGLVVIELINLAGRDHVSPTPIKTLLTY